MSYQSRFFCFDSYFFPGENLLADDTSYRSTKKPTFWHWTAVYNKLGPLARACKEHSPVTSNPWYKVEKNRIKTASSAPQTLHHLTDKWSKSSWIAPTIISHGAYTYTWSIPPMILWLGPVVAFWCWNGALAVYRSKLGALWWPNRRVTKLVRPHTQC